MNVFIVKLTFCFYHTNSSPKKAAAKPNPTTVSDRPEPEECDTQQSFDSSGSASVAKSSTKAEDGRKESF